MKPFIKLLIESQNKLPDMFSRTYYRLPNEEQLIDIDSYNLSAVDGNKLSHSYKVQPFNYFGQQREFPQDLKKFYKHSPKVDEQEEVVKTAIRDLNKYVVKLQIYKTALQDNYEGQWLDDKDFEQFPTQEDRIKFLETKFVVELI